MAMRAGLGLLLVFGCALGALIPGGEGAEAGPKAPSCDARWKPLRLRYGRPFTPMAKVTKAMMGDPNYVNINRATGAFMWTIRLDTLEVAPMLRGDVLPDGMALASCWETTREEQESVWRKRGFMGITSSCSVMSGSDEAMLRIGLDRKGVAAAMEEFERNGKAEERLCSLSG